MAFLAVFVGGRSLFQRQALLATAHDIEQRQSASRAAVPRQEAGPLGHGAVGEQP